MCQCAAQAERPVLDTRSSSEAGVALRSEGGGGAQSIFLVIERHLAKYMLRRLQLSKAPFSLLIFLSPGLSLSLSRPRFRSKHFSLEKEAGVFKINLPFERFYIMVKIRNI